MTNGTGHIDLVELEKQIAVMSVRTQLYRTLKTSLSKRGYWKNLPRYKGNTDNFGGKIQTNGNPEIL